MPPDPHNILNLQTDDHKSSVPNAVGADPPSPHRIVQIVAVVTCLTALLPITIGSFVTTLKAGMAFADWPTSDGHNMLLYPWLKDLRHTDKFVEHGHRLAGVLIGLVSIGLVCVCLRLEKRPWVRRFSWLILVAVIGQGLLGGMRVRLNAQTLAMLHSITGGLFFTLCFLFAGLVRSRPVSGDSNADVRISVMTFAAGVLLPVIVFGQYILGGCVRHLGTMLHEHLAGAAIVSLITGAVLVSVLRSPCSGLRGAGRRVLAALLFQVSLGLGAWVTKLGFPPMGWVAVMNSPQQNIICSFHTVGGMLLLATSSALCLELCRSAVDGRIESLRQILDPSGTFAGIRHGGAA
ncbi:MAG: COX15/CtaA family protein [Planctomycetaceae bacterium]|nr:COX15/CtaA family protein [Planctomycetaceae bacterium]